MKSKESKPQEGSNKMLVTVSQGAQELGVSPQTAYKNIRSGRWPAYKLGPRGTKLDVSEIMAIGRSVALKDQDLDQIK